MDRRIKRTRTAVFNAVIDLLLEKDCNKITVLELCKKADINKSTFYLHYKSMDDCLQRCFKVVMNGCIELAKKINYNEMRTNPEPYINPLLDEVEKNIEYLSRFKDSQICGPAVKFIKQSIVSSVAEFNGFTLENNYNEYTAITFIVGGCMDATIEMLPVFNKAELSKTLCKIIKR